MKKNRISIRDIAEHLNVSKTAVSFILSGKARENRIGDELTKRVLKYVEKVGYTPNPLAQSLRTGKTRMLALMVEDIANPFFAGIARLIEDEAYKVGYKIIYCSTDNDIDKTRNLIKMFRERSMDGYIITPPPGIEKEISSLVKDGIPVVLFDRFFSRLKTDYVVIDNQESAYEAVKHLIKNGCKNVAFVTLNSDQSQMMARLQGYEKAVKEHGFKRCVKKVAFHQLNESVTAEIAEFLEKHPAIDGVLFATNYLGINGLEAIARVGRKIADDLAVISFDDHDLFRLYTPSISAIIQPVRDISEQIVTLLLSRLNDTASQTASQKNSGIVLPARLLIRQSSSKKARK